MRIKKLWHFKERTLGNQNISLDSRYILYASSTSSLSIIVNKGIEDK